MTGSRPFASAVSTGVESLWQTWPEDKILRGMPEELTRLFHQAIPVLGFIGWRVAEVERGYTKTVLPLNYPGSNQSGTQQAALQLLAADYTGGTALASLFHLVPIIGIHRKTGERGAALWGAKASIKWLRPSVGDLTCTATIPEERWERIARRFFGGRAVLETVPMKLCNGDVPAAEVEFTYWGVDARRLQQMRSAGESVHILYDHRIKGRIRLLAGLRALEQTRPKELRRFEDPFAERFAGVQGRIMAERFAAVAPVLPDVVATTTQHLDRQLEEFHRGGGRQVVSIGVGLDTRAWRLSLPGTRWFELDEPVVLKARDHLTKEVGQPAGVDRIPLELTSPDGLFSLLDGCASFDRCRPTLFIWEHHAAHTPHQVLVRLLDQVAALSGSQDSRLWLDYPDVRLVEGTWPESPAIRAFVEGLQCRGEPFENGYSQLASALGSAGLAIVEDRACHLEGSRNGKATALGLFRYALLKPLPS